MGSGGRYDVIKKMIPTALNTNVVLLLHVYLFVHVRLSRGPLHCDRLDHICNNAVS